MMCGPERNPIKFFWQSHHSGGFCFSGGEEVSKQINKWPKLCSIVNQYHHPTVVIYTLRFEGETEHSVKVKLDEALATIPFFTLYSYLTFYINSNIMEEAVVTDVIDFPGTETIHLAISINHEDKYFLPRDLKTGKFKDIEKQVKCLEALRASHP